MDIKSIYKRQTGKEGFTYANDYDEFVVDYDFYLWLEIKVENAFNSSEELWK